MPITTGHFQGTEPGEHAAGVSTVVGDVAEADDVAGRLRGLVDQAGVERGRVGVDIADEGYPHVASPWPGPWEWFAAASDGDVRGEAWASVTIFTIPPVSLAGSPRRFRRYAPSVAPRYAAKALPPPAKGGGATPEGVRSKLVVIPELGQCGAFTVRSGRCQRPAGYLVPFGDRQVRLGTTHATAAARGPVTLWGSDQPPTTAPRGWAPWSAEEDAYVLANRAAPFGEVAHRLGRTVTSVNQRHARLTRMTRDAGSREDA